MQIVCLNSSQGRQGLLLVYARWLRSNTTVPIRRLSLSKRNNVNNIHFALIWRFASVARISRYYQISRRRNQHANTDKTNRHLLDLSKLVKSNIWLYFMRRCWFNSAIEGGYGRVESIHTHTDTHAHILLKRIPHTKPLFTGSRFETVAVGTA